MSEDIEKLKKLTIKVLQEEHDNHMENKKQFKNLLVSILLTVLPVFIFIITPGLADKYFHIFSGQLIYTGQDHYFGFSPTFLLDLPYFLPPLLWTLALWFCLKVRKETASRKSFLNYSILSLAVLNSVFFLYSIWFISSFFLK
ncbi:hypothetical protein A3D42_03040 [Candidatus Nomurabacteria bacterium RIFCSPHIGHO2_02_FULL_41_18]|uniref:Uncharacterized protein n=1 Tax=Candidatus Nomurabacteria bacterium RIFCSPHIGHO2_02_FULL_41_18 TaxID=1801754 RepID=A0A1F6W6H8_9BACT|nr:MAG: hypothetical protein A2737_02305 [Candidatus Nomurabacteria bacterium RIFCSPHIGHO2_01_FULL_41_71]OGI77528.1 MAG: hypothetical protein A3D42_03040 [Candidatus Nomurabacteria bacterium RIFCSPHIGHO2_02_FULL_41_18]OGI89545.1 MAG: hypothetical protein A3B01_00120 [Candidatus Nomurabacteria bacterium RIFCSPLOWO2_01_FULL_41_52b]